MTPGTTIATAEETARAQAAPAAPAAAAQEDERVKRFREGMRMAEQRWPNTLRLLEDA